MFLGHKNDLENQEWIVRSYLQDWSLTRLENEFYLVSNVCTHQGSYLRGTHGKSFRSCSYHGWSFKANGEPVGSGTTEHFCKNKKPLEKKSVYEWNGFLFSESNDLLDLGLDTADLELMEHRNVFLDCNPIHVMDIFLDVDHIPVIHSGVYEKINTPSIDHISWIMGKNTATQLVPFIKSDTEFSKTLLESDVDLPHGAAWLAVYPGTMIEWQPGAWFITVVHPDRHGAMIEVFKYRDSRYSWKNWKINEETWETAFDQDCAQSVRMKKNYLGTDNFEKPKLHFRKWLDRASKS